MYSTGKLEFTPFSEVKEVPFMVFVFTLFLVHGFQLLNLFVVKLLCFLY